MAADPRDLSTVANLQYWLQIDPNTQNPNDTEQLQRLLTAISVGMQKWLTRFIASDTYTMTSDGKGQHRLSTTAYPLQSVSSVYVDGSLVPPAISPTTHGWVISNNAVALRGYEFTRGYSNVQITYTAGYDTTPPDLEQACLELCGLRWREKSRIGEVSKNIGGEVVTFMVKDFPPSVLTTLMQYRRVIPL
jgi:hypothetical protein